MAEIWVLVLTQCQMRTGREAEFAELWALSHCQVRSGEAELAELLALTQCQVRSGDLGLGADGLSRKAIHDGGLWKLLTVRQTYLLSN